MSSSDSIWLILRASGFGGGNAMAPRLIDVLLVEDDLADAELFEDGLKQARGVRFAVTRVERLAEALDRLRTRSFDVVVLDVGLPDSEGLDGLQKIRSLARSVPILLLTGLDDEATALAAVQQGAQDYLIKGKVDDQLVARAIRYAIERKHGEELERAAEAAQAASRAKDHFLAVLSHELRTPLTPVLTAVSMLQDSPHLDASERETLEMVRRNVEMEARLIDDLLDMTRIARGKVELNRRRVSLCTVLHRAIEVCTPDIEARRLHFAVQMVDAPPFVQADAARLQQVFWNLIRNAVKFTPPGGCLGLRCYRQDSRAFVEISDSGIGIEPEALPRIFNAFEQENRATTRQFGGLGLGLAISKSLVELHGGSIRAESQGKHQGATFIVDLPLDAPGSVQELAPFARSAPGTRSLRILLVEDHGDTARILGHLLKIEGHQVQHAGDVATALEMIGHESFDLLLSDLGLPDGTGHDLMRQLVARGQKLPAIALSGYGMPADIEQSREAGFVQHLIKPIDPERLRMALAQVADPAGQSV